MTLLLDTPHFMEIELLTAIAELEARLGDRKQAGGTLDYAGKRRPRLEDALAARKPHYLPSHVVWDYIRDFKQIAVTQRSLGFSTEFQNTVSQLHGLLRLDKTYRVIEREWKSPPPEYDEVELQIQIARVHRDLGDTETVANILRSIEPQLHAFPIRASSYFLDYFAALQAWLGNGVGARTTLARYVHAWDENLQKCADEASEDIVNCFSWVVGHVAVAEAQATTGQVTAARETLSEALEKIHAIYTSLKARPDSAKRNYADMHRAAALAGICTVAADAGFTDLALHAHEMNEDRAYAWRCFSPLVRALAKALDFETAQKLSTHEQCCYQALVLGLTDRGEWNTAVQVAEASHADQQGDEWNMVDGNFLYYRPMAKARMHAQGIDQALAWARQDWRYRGVYRTTRSKAIALLGIIDAVLETRP